MNRNELIILYKKLSKKHSFHIFIINNQELFLIENELTLTGEGDIRQDSKFIFGPLG